MDDGNDTKMIDELMKDDEVKGAIMEFVALEVAKATKNIKAASKAAGKTEKKQHEKPKCFGKYYQDNQQLCRACPFAAECKKKSKTVKAKV